MRWIGLVVLMALTAACGDQSMLGPELDKGLASVDAALARGETEVACARLNENLAPFGDWALQARGERAAVANQLAEQLSGLATFCSGPSTNPATLAKGWPPLYKELRRISTFKTSWLTWFTYVSMIAVGVVTYWLLRRRRREG